MKFTYLLIDFFTIIIPFLFSFHPKLVFFKNWKPFFKSNSIVTTLFVIWDILFTKSGIWGFNPNYLVGIYIYNLPIEEILFFICIPYSCVFTYHCIGKFWNIQWPHHVERIVVLIVALTLITIGVYYNQKLYTSYTFISLSLLIIVLKFIIKVNWLDKFISIYGILLIPFFIVNGILTGSLIENPVVWYSSGHILNLRIGTIPIEDIFYGFELLLLNVFLYNYFKSHESELINLKPTSL